MQREKGQLLCNLKLAHAEHDNKGEEHALAREWEATSASGLYMSHSTHSEKAQIP